MTIHSSTLEDTVLSVPETTQEIAPGLVLETYCSGHIVAYRLTNMSRTVIAQWADLVIRTLESWPADYPYLALHDISMPGIALQYGCLTEFDTMNIGISPTGRNQVYELITTREQRAQIALNFNLALSGHINKVLADNRTLSRSRHPLITYRTFYNPDKALEWLGATITTNTATTYTAS